MDTGKAKQRKKHGRGEYIAAVIINVILLFIFNNLLHWGVPFLTERFSSVLWAINLSLGATILANLIFLVYAPGWLRHLLKMVLNLISMFAIYLFVAVFPFTFAGETWAVGIKIIFIIAIAGTGIAFIVEFFKLLLGKD